jgi:CBS domain-containing protein
VVTVAELMTKHVEYVAPDASAQEAAALMGELDVSALPVGRADALQGVLTDRDLLYRVVAEGRDPRRTRVAEVATRLVYTCRADDPVNAAMDLMAAHSIRRLAVVDGDRVVGWLTLSDVARRLLVDSAVLQSGLKEIVEPVTPSPGTGAPGSPPVRPTAAGAPPGSAGTGG